MTDEPFALFLEGRRAQLRENPKYIPKENPMKLTAVFMEVPEGYIAFIEELPGANTQGETLEETRKNRKEEELKKLRDIDSPDCPVHKVEKDKK